MIDSQTILQALPNVLKTIDIPDLGKKYQGKVRDFYITENQRVLITTDRQSGFDVLLGYVPYKGAVLNQLSAFWFEETRDIIDNHMISVPDPNVMIGKNCKGIAIEMIIRGYLTGTTNTSLWYSYERGERSIYGMDFPEGLRKNQKLSEPVITPTTHAPVGSHDERLTRHEILQSGIVSEALYKKMEEVTFALFERGTQIAEQAGLILVDTKYEFGIYEDKLILMDEIHTPDGSRFWIKDTYEERFARGEEPENFDKEFIRLWYTERIDPYTDPIPPMPDALVVAASKRYISVYEKLTGKMFKAFVYPIEERIRGNLAAYL